MVYGPETLRNIICLRSMWHNYLTRNSQMKYTSLQWESINIGHIQHRHPSRHRQALQRNYYFRSNLNQIVNPSLGMVLIDNTRIQILR
jgi:hypothetical protein